MRFVLVSSKNQKWVIKNKNGQILGPFETSDILEKINNGEFSGDEYISFYPDINWKPITNDMTFYDELLKSLSDQVGDKQNKNSPQIKKTDKTPETINSPASDGDKDSGDHWGASEIKVVGGKKINETSDKNKSEKKNIGGSDDTVSGGSQEFEQKKKSKVRRIDSESSKKKPSQKNNTTKKSVSYAKASGDREVLDLKEQSELNRNVKKKYQSKPIAVISGVFIFLLLWLFWPSNKLKNRVHLLVPSTKVTKISKDQLKGVLQRGLRYYELDTQKNYYKAQNIFVRILESEPQNHQVWSFLCMSYLEIWPYSYQDNKDLLAMSNAVQKASKLNAGGQSALTCQATDLLIKGRVNEAKSIAETVLENYGSQGEPPIVFYYLKSRILKLEKDFDVAVGYARSAQKLWPSWLKAYALEGELQELNNNNQFAAQIYRNILASNPEHMFSKIKLGVIEFKHFKHSDLSEKLIKEALSSNDYPPGEVVSRGYLTLSQIAINNNNQSEALKYSKKAYAYNPLNLSAKKIIQKLGGEGSLTNLQIDVREMIYEGDQFFRQGDFETAQAHYKSAFELDSKNAQAALKLAKCMWALSFSELAIQWLNKAIATDPGLIEAYITLAKYHSEQFNFTLAGIILNKANTVQPNSYEVFRGFAFVEYKRRSYSSSIKYAHRAIKLYVTDIESYVILAKSYLEMRNFQEAYATASKAIEIDPNDKSAQSIYAKSLAGLQGVDVGITHAIRLVESFPLVVEYRRTLGEIYLSEERYIDAEKVLEQLISIDEKYQPGFLLLGKTYRAQQKFQSAIDTYFKAALLNPADATSLFEAGLVYFDMKKLSKAKSQFNRVLKVNKKYLDTHYYLGQIALLQSNYKEALAQADLEIKINPNIPNAYLLKAETYLSMKQYSLCAREYQQAIKLAPQGVKSYIRVAKCYRLSGNLDVAIQMLKQAARIESGQPDIYKEQGAIFETKGESELAIESYKQYFLLAPNAPDKAQLQMRIERLQGR